MRILYLHQHYSSPAGATATRSHAMAQALQARGVPVGGDLDWLDDGTIVQALRARRPA